MTRFIKKYVTACIDCCYNKDKYGKQEGKLYPIEKPDEPMHTVHIDHLGPFEKSSMKNSYLLVLVDSFSKFVIVRPVKTLSSVETIKNLREIFCMFAGIPKRVISDNGLAFTSKRFKEFALKYQFKHILNAVACPRSNGQVERYNRTVLDAIRTSTKEETDWDAKLPEIIWGINNTINSSTKFTPHELMYSHKSNLLNNLENVAENNSSLSEKRLKAKENLKKQVIE